MRGASPSDPVDALRWEVMAMSVSHSSNMFSGAEGVTKANLGET